MDGELIINFLKYKIKIDDVGYSRFDNKDNV